MWQYTNKSRFNEDILESGHSPNIGFFTFQIVYDRVDMINSTGKSFDIFTVK